MRCSVNPVEISTYRRNHSIKETCLAFHTSWKTVNMIAPSTPIETRMRRVAGIRAYHERNRLNKAIMMERIKPEIARIDSEIKELEERKAELLRSIG